MIQADDKQPKENTQEVDLLGMGNSYPTSTPLPVSNVPPTNPFEMEGNGLKKEDQSGEDSDDDSSDDSDDSDLLEPFPSQPKRDEFSSNMDMNKAPQQWGPEEEEDEDDETLRPGDHVFALIRRSFGLGTYQKHGIVLSTNPDDAEDVTIVSFYPRDSRDREASDGRVENESLGNDESLLNEGTASSRQRQNRATGVRAESLHAFASKNSNPNFANGAKIQKVKYGKNLAKRILSRAGTVTSCAADERGLVVARVKFLLEYPESMPDFQKMSANDECAAVWCRIGRWCTLQGASILHIMIVGHAGGAAVGGVVASNITLWAPMPGFWGSVGYWWYVPATVAYPILVPILIGFGMVSLVPLEILRRYRKKWAELSCELNETFWAKTDDEVKEYYFASSMSTNDEWMKKFFIHDADKEQEENTKGNYQPLSCATNGAGDMDDEDDEDMQRLAAEYGQQQKSDENEQSFKARWMGRFNRNKNEKKAEHTTTDHDDSWDDARLLNEGRM